MYNVYPYIGVDNIVNTYYFEVMDIGKAIQNHRKNIGLSLRALAQAIAVNPSYLSRVESGQTPPSEELIHKLANRFQCREDELLLLAGKLPVAIKTLVERDPYRVASALQTIAELAVAEPGVAYGNVLYTDRGPRAIEDGFPFEALSEIAEVESWRKEIYRPVYHVHKWWAQRLGSVFRAAILAAAAPKGSSVMDLFYEPVRLPGVVVFDPFMGSGTTVGEAQKLGCTAIGRDINPVAFRAVRTALGTVDRGRLYALFKQLEANVGQELRQLYRGLDRNGNPCDVLYYFWVKILPCPSCAKSVDLFSKYIFARHAYVKKNPTVHVVCPACGEVFASRYDAQKVTCCVCKSRFDPHCGSAKRTTAVCNHCGHEFSIAKTARARGEPPEHRLYAKLVLRADGTKEYLRISDADLAAFRVANERLEHSDLPVPHVAIQDGYNTRQILNYGYQYWHELFNARQLLALTHLARAIQKLPGGPEQEALASLFSGVLEFNNMFASYKGEGTGAVRHMFSHHILKPERMPIEANVWGTTKSSGSFATLFRSRLLRAIDYREAPFELAVEYMGERKKGRKVLGISAPMGSTLIEHFPKDGLKAGSTYLSCGSSDKIDLPNKSVDLIVTDPPFFDNVHYSELADFFYVWQELYFNGGAMATTRDQREVQDTDADAFAEKLKNVFKECHRVLRDDGLLVFSYHHSREDGWAAVAEAVLGSGFSFVQSQPVKSEMSVAAPKSQAKEPIDLDVLLVCRKKSDDKRNRLDSRRALSLSVNAAVDKVFRFNSVGRRLSKNDVRVVLLSQLIVELCAGRISSEAKIELEQLAPETRLFVNQMWANQEVDHQVVPFAVLPQVTQMTLFEPDTRSSTR